MIRHLSSTFSLTDVRQTLSLSVYRLRNRAMQTTYRRSPRSYPCLRRAGPELPVRATALVPFCGLEGPRLWDFDGVPRGVVWSSPAVSPCRGGFGSC